MIKTGERAMAKRLTSHKSVSDMTDYELALNSCYAKNREARYRDRELDESARDIAIRLWEAHVGDDSFPSDSINEGIDDFLYG